jgi:hypothetical protein
MKSRVRLNDPPNGSSNPHLNPTHPNLKKKSSLKSTSFLPFHLRGFLKKNPIITFLSFLPTFNTPNLLCGKKKKRKHEHSQNKISSIAKNHTLIEEESVVFPTL